MAGKLAIINTQWLYKEPVEKFSETEKTITVTTEKGPRKFWKKNGLMVGYSKLRGIGECDRIIFL